VRLANKLDFTIMKRLKTGAVPDMDHHRLRQKVAHIFHHPELAEFIE